MNSIENIKKGSLEADVAIRVMGLTKIYKLPLSKAGKTGKEFSREAVKRASEKALMKHTVNSAGVMKSGSTEFKALDNVSFDIRKGEIIGIIGHNGAGKSTLLKLLTGVAFQTSGTIEINGKIASLLELGSGFNPDLTGIENIYFNGSLNGLSNKEVKEKIPGIIEFADIGDYVYEPVRSYSSGMFARLAFATAININPDILIIDEILSVGDIGFQVKCMEKFLAFKEEGKTIIFVSHSIDVVKKFCARVIWMDHGKIVADGNPIINVERYFNINYNPANDEPKNHICNKDISGFKIRWKTGDTEYSTLLTEELSESRSAALSNEFNLKNGSILHSVGSEAGAIGENYLDFKSMLKLQGEFDADRSFENSYCRMDLIRCDGKAGIETEFDMFVNSFTALDGGVKRGIPAGKNLFEFEIEKLNLMAGDYYLDFLLIDGDEILYRKVNIFSFRIMDEYRGEGLIIPEHTWGG